jgi:hypothetical protein
MDIMRSGMFCNMAAELPRALAERPADPESVALSIAFCYHCSTNFWRK